MRRASAVVIVGALWAASVNAQPATDPVAPVVPVEPAPTQPAPVEGVPSTPPAEPAGCTTKKFRNEIIFEDTDLSEACPKVRDVNLDALRARLIAAPVKDTAAFFEVLRALRNYISPPSTSEAFSWRAALAQHIDEVFEQVKKGRHVLAAFGDARAPLRDADPLECLFVTGDAGQPGYMCFVIAGAPTPPRALGNAAIVTHVLPDFTEAYVAYQTLGIARAALLKLEVPELDKAIARLKVAQKRWNNMRSQGYVQYPWELALSNTLAAYGDYRACFADDAYCTGEEGLDPERVRVIALHPGVGAGFQGFGFKGEPSADGALALSVEALGFTAYSTDFDWYWGLSAGAVVNDADFGDIRFGPFVHLTRWVHVGYLFSVMREAARGDATLFLSMDLATAFGASFFE